ncbi:MAG: tyrosine-type recombinase/integrase [candidate division Zixibacteria bacterium]|nr:tyrosine-type recombinase/integrase [candidate division Zixibacteria bacterium]MBU1469491.1 tyrosine-type recombinase/integrase [candidate division Zixibacteria bacterium]
MARAKSPSSETLVTDIQAFGRRLNADGRSPKTVSAYLRDLSTLAEAIERRYPGITTARVTSSMIDEALTSPDMTRACSGRKRSPASMHRFKAAVRSFFSWAEQSGIVSENPAVSLRLRRLPRTPPRFLTEAEKKRLLKELRGKSSLLAQRDRLIIELFLGTGIRLHELVSLDIEDIDLDSKHLRVRAKGSVPQVKFLKTNLRFLLRAFLIKRRRLGDGERHALFISNRGERLCERQVARRVIYWLKAAGIDKKLTPHSLRHTFATHLYSRTGDILVVQRALGHRDLSTTQIYTHLVDGALEEALERL